MCNQPHPNTDLSAKTPGWHSYREVAPGPSSPDYQTVFVLTCTCKTEKHAKVWTTLHRSRDAALAYAEKERCVHQSRGEADVFSMDIYEAVLDIRKVRFSECDSTTCEPPCSEPYPTQDTKH